MGFRVCVCVCVLFSASLFTGWVDHAVTFMHVNLFFHRVSEQQIAANRHANANIVTGGVRAVQNYNIRW